MRKLYIQAEARLDLLEIWNFIAEESLDAAIRVGEKLEASILELRMWPRKGHVRPDVKDKTVRFWRVYSYMIAYRFDETSLTIVRVVHGRRNLRRLFRKRKS